jgi:hypothetical protein
MIAIYCLTQGLDIVYVGSTINLQRRLYGHRRDGTPFTEVYVHYVRPEDRYRIESNQIRRLRPRLNENSVLIP